MHAAPEIKKRAEGARAARGARPETLNHFDTINSTDTPAPNPRHPRLYQLHVTYENKMTILTKLHLLDWIDSMEYSETYSTEEMHTKTHAIGNASSF